MAVFVHAKGGLMYEATIGVQKYNYRSLENAIIESSESSESGASEG